MTAQFHEKLLLEGQETSMAIRPAIPYDHPQITILNKDEVRVDIEAGKTSSYVFSTACWREYIGTWQLSEGKLYLANIQGIYRLTSSEPLFADWVTTILRIPEGECLRYVHMGFASVYEFDRYIKIENGLVMDEWRTDNRQQQEEE